MSHYLIRARVTVPCSALVCAWTVTLTFMNALAATIPTRDWWYSAKDDSLWTNRPVADIRERALKGDAAAQYYLGRAFFFDTTTNRSVSESYRWIRRSAEQGYSQAELLLARFCYLGLETPRGESDRFHWATRAANHGNADAIALVGVAYMFGEGTPRDAKASLDWLRLAWNAGASTAARWLGQYYFNGEAGTTRRTNFVEALRWFEIGASNGGVYSATMVVDMYEKGLGTPPNSSRVLHWTRLLADRGNPDMMEKLSSLYTAGLAEPRDAGDTSIELLRKAAVVRAKDSLERGPDGWELNSSWCLIHDCQALSRRYRSGVATPRDYVAAAQWMWQSRQEDVRRVAAGQRSLTDTNPPANPLDRWLKAATPPWSEDERRWRQAVQLVHDALDLRKPEAWHQIGDHYRDGSPLTPQDCVQAWAWFSRAASMGHAPAGYALREVEAKLAPEELTQAKRFWIPPSAPSY